MARTVYIEIKRNRVFEEVHKTTEYIGHKAVSAEDPGAYERVAAIAPNDEQLERYFSEACAAAQQALGHWLDNTNWVRVPSERDSTEYLGVLLNLPDNWIPALQSAVEEQLMSHLVNGVVWRWLMQVKKDEAQAYAAMSNEAMLRMQQLLLARKRPARRAAPSGDDEPQADGLWHDEAVWLDANNWIENN